MFVGRWGGARSYTTKRSADDILVCEKASALVIFAQGKADYVLILSSLPLSTLQICAACDENSLQMRFRGLISPVQLPAAPDARTKRRWKQKYFCLNIYVWMYIILPLGYVSSAEKRSSLRRSDSQPEPIGFALKSDKWLGNCLSRWRNSVTINSAWVHIGFFCRLLRWLLCKKIWFWRD